LNAAAPAPRSSQFFQSGQASQSSQFGRSGHSLWTRRLVTCPPELPISEAVARMIEAGGAPITLINEEGQPVGLITDRELRGFVTTGLASGNAPAATLMNSKFQTVSPGLKTADYLLEMARGRCQELVITVDGTTQTPLQGVVTDDDLTIICGRNPTLLIREALAAESVEDLSDLRQRAETFLAENLVGPTTVEWLWQMASEVNAAFIERVTQIAEAEMARAGRPHPGTQACWLFFGRAGRQEALARETPVLGVVYQDLTETEREKDAARKYFSTLVQKVEVKLRGCGFSPRQNLSGTMRAGTAREIYCRSYSEWKDFYSGLIRDPIGNAIYDACDFFDARVVCGDPAPWLALRKALLAELERNEAFIPVLANDTLAALPPLTFFQGSVIESDGARRQTLDLEKTALNPIVDAARVFALDAGEVSSPNTLRRLELAAAASPLRASVFYDAADGLRIASYQQALAQFNGTGEDMRINPSRLSRFEQRLLKTAFDSVRRLIELTSTTYDLDQRLSGR
jgi:CBS domain-containing protein